MSGCWWITVWASWPRGHFLFFASPKKRKQKKGDRGCRFGLWPNFPHAAGFWQQARTRRLGRLKQASLLPCQNPAVFGCASGDWQGSLKVAASFKKAVVANCVDMTAICSLPCGGELERGGRVGTCCPQCFRNKKVGSECPPYNLAIRRLGQDPTFPEIQRPCWFCNPSYGISYPTNS